MALMRDDVLVIGAGPAGLLAAWIAGRRGAKVRLLAAGIGTTHVTPGWIRVLDVSDTCEVPGTFIADHPDHPYALAGADALRGGIATLREIGKAVGLNYVGDDLTPSSPPSLPGKGEGGIGVFPTALGATMAAALVPESFAAGDLRASGALLIAGPAGWRDFYPKLCAENLARAGYEAHGVTFDLPEMAAASRFDATPPGLARLFDWPEVRARIAAQIKPQLAGATRIGLPAVIGLEHHAEAWRDLQERLGVPVFEIPTLPPSVPGIRLYNALKAVLLKLGVPILLDMTATRGVVAGQRATGVIVPDVVRDRIYQAETIILATGGLYGGGIVSDHTGALREAIFGLPLHIPTVVETLHATSLLQGNHPIHQVGVRINPQMQPVDESGRVTLENVRIAGRLLANYDPLAEGSTEGVWLATAWRAAMQ